MSAAPYAFPAGGLPAQSALMTQRAVFTESYAVIPRACCADITASALPGWEGTRAWVLARPLSGFAETFSQYAMEVRPGGGSTNPDDDAGAQHALFLCAGAAAITIDGQPHHLTPGGFAYIPPQAEWHLHAEGSEPARFHWIRKRWQPAPGLAPAPAFTLNEQDITPTPMPDTEGRWATTRLIDPADMRHDMHVNIVTFQPGGTIPFEETHVMEHGLAILQGKGAYRLNRDWVEVEAGDFIWLRAFCPQACYAGGSEPFRYLLYKDVNRHAPLTLNR
ncbi:MAG: (S)-ureidoglycine aminohydrolase [Pararhodobacter sp.]|nr:(S)-ureidoglycine aminohydrolase [Pararhodobacter sp.]